MNFNEDDPLNPLVALMAGRPRYGEAGQWMPFDADPGGGFGQFDASQYTDPRFWEQYTLQGSETGSEGQQWRPRGAVQERLGGRVQVHDLNTGGQGQIIDPSKVEYDPEFGLVTMPDNVRPNSSRTLRNNLIIAAMMAPAAYGVAGAMSAGGGAAGGGGGGALYGAYDPAVAASQVGGAGSVFTPGLGEVGAAGASGAAGATGIGTQAAVPVTELSTTAAGAAGGSGVVSALGGYGNLARLVAAGAMAGGSSGSSGGSGPGGGSSGDPNSIIEAMANANRVNHSTPFGSRQWSQGADGRWSVADTLSEAEQSNFEGVQGLNAGITGLAGQRLAAMLAGGGRRRGTPMTFNGMSLGG